MPRPSPLYLIIRIHAYVYSVQFLFRNLTKNCQKFPFLVFFWFADDGDEKEEARETHTNTKIYAMGKRSHTVFVALGLVPTTLYICTFHHFTSSKTSFQKKNKKLFSHTEGEAEKDRKKG